ncbi:hypothetical protein K7X08_018565 [Anisodus acutangulus]|uniref:Uncharacterized protein n=1 Tax=Anisodus acutangulus TaxID=402998 RepID=A0A9Q1LWB3_9SOLA|nr:hypothetical protein K7X08_018565 [Anisodus acutangulus]
MWLEIALKKKVEDLDLEIWRLQLIDHAHPDGDWGSFGGDCSFEIVAPYIQHLKISGDFDSVEIRLGDLSSLVHVDLTFAVDVVFDKKVEHLLASVRCANELILSCWFAEMIYMLVLEKKDVSLPLLECKFLDFKKCHSRHRVNSCSGEFDNTSSRER